MHRDKSRTAIAANGSRGDELRHFVWRGITRFGLPLQVVGWLIMAFVHPPRSLIETRSPGVLVVLVFSILFIGVLSGALYGFVMWWLLSQSSGRHD